MANKLHYLGKASDGSGDVYVFHCPGCGYSHPFHTNGDPKVHPQWFFNGDLTCPTFAPSLLCNKDRPESRCHSFVTKGQIKFLDDCYHGLKGQTVELPDWDCNEAELRTAALRRNLRVI